MNDLAVAKWWENEGGSVRCRLCPHLCLVPEGRSGLCLVRKNIGGRLYSLFYGAVSVSTVDPIEKKPLFHFMPGSKLYSVGSFGCNLRCIYCQNYPLVEGGFDSAPHRRLSPESLVDEAVSKGVDGIAWTFNEPVVWSEFVIDASRLARKRGLFCVLNTNGYVSDAAREPLLESVDAVRVDVKGFSDASYLTLCGGRLSPVLGTCIAAAKHGIHLELAYPVIKAKNDSPAEIGGFCSWVLECLGPETPVHFIMVHPFHRLQLGSTASLEDLMLIRRHANERGLKYVYIGGTPAGEAQNTLCPNCGKTVIQRSGDEISERIYFRGQQVSRFCPVRSRVVLMTKGKSCPYCGEAIAIRTSPAER